MSNKNDFVATVILFENHLIIVLGNIETNTFFGLPFDKLMDPIHPKISSLRRYNKVNKNQNNYENKNDCRQLEVQHNLR